MSAEEKQEVKGTLKTFNSEGSRPSKIRGIGVTRPKQMVSEGHWSVQVQDLGGKIHEEASRNRKKRRSRRFETAAGESG